MTKLVHMLTATTRFELLYNDKKALFSTYIQSIAFRYNGYSKCSSSIKQRTHVSKKHRLKSGPTRKTQISWNVGRVQWSCRSFLGFSNKQRTIPACARFRNDAKRSINHDSVRTRIRRNSVSIVSAMSCRYLFLEIYGQLKAKRKIESANLAALIVSPVRHWENSSSFKMNPYEISLRVLK